MTNKHFKEVLLGKALTFKHSNNSNLLESFPDSMADQLLDQTELPIKQVCAKISESLSNRIDDVSSDLGISKRSFIELALINALDEFDQIAKEYDIYYDPRDHEDSNNE